MHIWLHASLLQSFPAPDATELWKTTQTLLKGGWSEEISQLRSEASADEDKHSDILTIKGAPLSMLRLLTRALITGYGRSCRTRISEYAVNDKLVITDLNPTVTMRRLALESFGMRRGRCFILFSLIFLGYWFSCII
jgi:hypothetical protein